MKSYFLISLVLGAFAAFFATSSVPQFSWWIYGIAIPIVLASLCAFFSITGGAWKDGRQFVIAGMGIAFGSALTLYILPLVVSH